MRLAWSPLFLLLIYLLLVFLICRLFDLIFTSHQNITPTAIVDPIILSVRQLKLLLEHRGVSYTGYVEKKELVHLVEASADLVQGEVDEITLSSSNENDRTKLLTTPQSSYFSGSDHFYEQVEDTKDSVWLVQVIPSGSRHSEPLLDDYNWRVIQNQVAPFSIRTGIFHCKLDKRLCNIKGWYEPLLLLAMPRGSKPKDKVVIRSCKYTRPQVIMEWMREQLSIRVHKITDLEEIEYDWLQSRNNNNNTTEHFQDIKVLLLTHLLHPPLFLAALSIKFTGRIKFGMFSVKKEDSEALNKRLSLHTPSYLVITPERTIVYGQRQGEHFHYWAMNALLRIIQPEMNDVFICSLLIFNMMASLQVIQMSTGLWWIRIMSALWIYVKYNFWLFIGWLVIYGTQGWPLIILMMQYCQVMIRYFGLSDLGSIIQRDCQLLFKHPYVFFISFLDFAVFMKIIRDGLYTEAYNEREKWVID
uniref:Uncharacterized protein n=1 Tax=Clastoptera arizonana TaxID=38151 RepID=A0A1B6CX40_9HEMI